MSSCSMHYGVQSTAKMYKIVGMVAGNEKRRAMNSINDSFFGGAPFITDKSFKMVFNVSKPAPVVSGTSIDLRKKKDFYVVWGVLEGMPFLGSFLAIFAVIGNSFRILSTEIQLKKAIKALPVTVEHNPTTAAGAKYFMQANKVFRITVERTLAENRVYGSLASLIPYLKPAMIGWQSGVYYMLKLCPTKISGTNGI